MKQKLFALLLCMVFICTLSLPVYADAATTDSDGYSVLISDIPTVCPTCGAKLYATWASTSGAEVEVQISAAGSIKIPAGAGSFAHIKLRCDSCGYEKSETRLLGLDFGHENPGNLHVEKVPTGIGRKDLPGYASDDGTPSVSSDGGIIWQPTWGDYLDMNFYLNFTSSYYGSYGDSYNLGNMRNGAYNSTNSGKTESYTFDGTSFIVSWNYIDSSYASNGVFATASGNSGVFKVKTPVKGYYSLIKSPKMYFKAGDETFYYSADTKSTLYDIDSVLAFSKMLSVGFFKNEVTSSHHVWIFYTPKYKIIPFSASDKPTSQTNITINNNTWNGNIYTDNSTNLTYIYPQYTTINESGDTVTNISNNPIIYNNETKQYYTYDTVTNNYYYITYEQQPATPTPSPSPSPSPAPTETPSPSESPAPTPTPDPDENPAPTPTPGGGTIITPGGGGSGSGSGSSSGITGGDDEGLFGWLWDLLKDLVKAILKAIFKVLSGLLGFLIWLVERVGILLPFLPAPAIAALGAGVVLVFVIRIIRFIRG